MFGSFLGLDAFVYMLKEILTISFDASRRNLSLMPTLSVTKRVWYGLNNFLVRAHPFTMAITSQELQAMDNSHVALVAVELKSDGFVKYRCDRPMPLGVNLTSLTKVLKCAKDDDIVTLSATENGDVLNLKYEAKSKLYHPLHCDL